MTNESVTEPAENALPLVVESTEKLAYVPPVLERHEGWVDVIGVSI